MIQVLESNPVGNAVAIAWSNTDLIGIITRAGWRGPLRGFVLDASDPIRLLASFPVPNEPRTGHAMIGFPDDEPDVVVTSDGRTATRWHARTGAQLEQRELAGRHEHGRVLAILAGGRLLMSWLDASHEQPRWELRTVDLVRGEHRREPDVLSKAAAHGLLAPLANGDYVTLHEGQLTRFGSDAVVRWQVSEARTINLLHVDPRGLVLISNAGGHAQVRDAEHGRVRAEFPIHHACAIGIANDEVWIAQANGEITWRDSDGVVVRKLALGQLCMDLVIAPDHRRALVLIDRLNLLSEARVVDLGDGSTTYKTKPSFAPAAAVRAAGTLWIAGDGGVVRIDERDGSLTFVHGKPSAALAVAHEQGTAAFVSGLKLLIAAPLDAKPHRLDRVQGEPLVAVSHAGTHVFIVDEHSARLLEVATATRQFTLAREALDELTIDTIDRVFFDDAGHPYVEAGGHSYRVGADTLGLATPTLTPSAASLTAVVGSDEIIRLIDLEGDSVLRIHLSPNGKAGVVEDGQAIDWMGAPAQAKTCRTIVVNGEVVRGKALEPWRCAGLYARALEDT